MEKREVDKLVESINRFRQSLDKNTKAIENQTRVFVELAPILKDKKLQVFNQYITGDNKEDSDGAANGNLPEPYSSPD